MDNQVQFQKNIRIIAFLFIAYVVIGASMWIPEVWDYTTIRRHEEDGFFIFFFNWLGFPNRLLFNALILWLSIVLRLSSGDNRRWKAASIFLILAFLCDMATGAGELYKFLTAHSYDDYYNGYLAKILFFMGNSGTLFIIIAFILIVWNRPHPIFGMGLCYIICQFVNLCFSVSRGFIFRSFVEKYDYGWRSPEVLEKISLYLFNYIPFAVFLLVNISLLIFLFGLSKHPLPASQNPAAQEIENAENAQHPNS